jgi:hypothetical protein
MLLYNVCSSPYFDFTITGIIGLNIFAMSIEFYMMPSVFIISSYIYIKLTNFIFFIIKSILKIY